MNIIINYVSGGEGFYVQYVQYPHKPDYITNKIRHYHHDKIYVIISFILMKYDEYFISLLKMSTIFTSPPMWCKVAKPEDSDTHVSFSLIVM